MTKIILAALVAAMTLTITGMGTASPNKQETKLVKRERLQVKSLAHAEGVVTFWKHRHTPPLTERRWLLAAIPLVPYTVAWHTKQIVWLKHELGETRSALAELRIELATPVEPWYVTKQIQVAEIIGHASNRDPWPNCPDPIWNGAGSWSDTVACENGGNWLDSSGYYRCGLQFDPGWERRYGQLCP